MVGAYVGFDAAGGSGGGGGMSSSSSSGRRGGGGGGRSTSSSHMIDSLLVDKDRQTYVWSKVEILQQPQTTAYDDNEVNDEEGEEFHGSDDRESNHNISEAADDGEGGDILDDSSELIHQGDGRRNERRLHRHPRIPPPRSGAASVVLNSKLYLYGGYGGGTGRLDDFWMFDLKEQRWSEVDVVSDEKPGCRENNGVVISDSNRSFIMFGG